MDPSGASDLVGESDLVNLVDLMDLSDSDLMDTYLGELSGSSDLMESSDPDLVGEADLVDTSLVDPSRAPFWSFLEALSGEKSRVNQFPPPSCLVLKIFSSSCLARMQYSTRFPMFKCSVRAEVFLSVSSLSLLFCNILLNGQRL